MTNVPTNSTLIDEMDSPILRPNQASLRQQSAAHPGSLSRYDTWLFQRSGGDDSPGPAFDLVNPALFWSSDPLAQARLVKSRKVEYVVVEDSEDSNVAGSVKEYARQHGHAIQTFCPGGENPSSASMCRQ